MTNLSSLPRAVFFDWDGTLADTHHTEFSPLCGVMTQMGKPALCPEAYMNSPSLSVRDYFASLFSPEESHQAVRCYVDMASRVLDHLKVFPIALTVLNWLRERNIPMGIVSNKEATLLRGQIHHLKWEGFFSAIIGSGDLSHDKPSPVPLLHALGLAQQKPGKDVWFVGDSEVDMMCAAEANCLPVSVGAHADGFKGHFVKAGDCQGFYNLLTSLKTS
jgi:phosphoglycolate phosphatase